MSRILVIDDDEQVRALLSEILRRAGHDVAEAVNGADGLAQYQARPADLVITDLIMPEKEGVETILELRKAYPTVRIIAISGGGRAGPRNLLPIAAAVGARRVIVKPFSRQEILEAVRESLAA